jgi:LPS sulfotransferase NodH
VRDGIDDADGVRDAAAANRVRHIFGGPDPQPEAHQRSDRMPREPTFPNTSYLIFFTPRSGSFLLCEALTTSGLAGFPAEYFGAVQADRLGKSWGVRCQADYLRMLLRHRTTVNGVFGAKVTWRHFGVFVARSRDIDERCRALPPAALASALLPNLRYVWLTRRDKLRQAISYSRALQTGVWNVTGQDVADHGALQYDRVSITRLLQAIRDDEVEARKYFSVNGINPLTIVYEEFVSRYEATCGDILRYLGVQPPDEFRLPSPTLTKQGDALTEQWVQRYEEDMRRANE